MRDRDYDDQRDEPTRPLDQDYKTPFSPPDDVGTPKLPNDYPAGDDLPDQQEVYDEGTDNAELDNPPGGDQSASPRPKKKF